MTTDNKEPYVTATKPQISAHTRMNALGDAELRQLEINARFQDLSRLREKITAFKRRVKTVSGFPEVRGIDCAEVITDLRKFFLEHERTFIVNDDPISASLLGLIDDFRDSPIQAYGGEVMALNLLKAEILAAMGRNEDALALTSAMATRPQTIEAGPDFICDVMYLDTALRAATGKTASIARLAIARFMYLVSLRPRYLLRHFRLLHGHMGLAHAGTEPMPAYYGWLRSLAALRHRLSRWDRSSFWSVWAGRGVSLITYTLTACLIQLGVKPAMSEQQPALSKKSKKETAKFIISRPMGGLGDIIMMTPGIKALAQKAKHPVYFATQPKFFPIFANNPDVITVDINSDIDFLSYTSWVNFGFCPAASYESNVVPRVKRSRIQLFAEAMGISYKKLTLSGTAPKIYLASEDEKVRDELRKRKAQSKRLLVGIAPYSRDDYKDYPNIIEIANKVAETHDVAIFHSSEIEDELNPNIIKFTSGTLRETFARIAACDYFISVDTGLFHVAAAFEIPCLSIFGPTDGRLFEPQYTNIVSVDMSLFHCAPCWRNQDSPCILTRKAESACLKSLSVASVLDQFEILKVKFPKILSL